MQKLFFVVALFQLFQVSYLQEYQCRRLVIEKERCLVYNYNHPEYPHCKKWDVSRCGPPKLIRETSHCVSYTCTQISPQLPIDPVPLVVVKPNTSESAQDSQDSLSSEVDLLDLLRKDFERLKSEDLGHLEEQQRLLEEDLAQIQIKQQDFEILAQDIASLDNELVELQKSDEDSAQRLNSLNFQLQNLRTNFLIENSRNQARLTKIESDIKTINEIVGELQAQRPQSPAANTTKREVFICVICIIF